MYRHGNESLLYHMHTHKKFNTRYTSLVATYVHLHTYTLVLQISTQLNVCTKYAADYMYN